MTTLQQRPPTERPPTALPPGRGGFNLTAWAIDHPYPVVAFYVAVVLLAVAAVLGGALPRRMMPYVESPLVGIVTTMPGLSASEMETYVSKPIEERMTDIRGARFLRSTSQDGLSIVSLEFPYGANISKATLDVQALMNAVQADLPQTGANLKPSWVLPIDPLNIPILSLSATGDADKGWTPARVRQFAENQGVAALKQVSDVQSVMVYGGEKRQLRVIVNRDKLAAYGYSILDVRDAINKNSVAQPAGTITSGPGESIVRVSGLAQNGQSVGAYPLGVKNGQVVSIKDVADVRDDVRESRSGFHFVDGRRRTIEGVSREAVELAVIQNPASGSPSVVKAVTAKAAQLEADNPGLHLRVAYDNAHFVNILFRNTGEELLVAVALCGLAVWLFLGNGRATVISMTTIPVSLAMAILLMIPFGFSLNSSTLIGLLLAIGRLVDDSVIDIHAVQRHLKMGKDARTATIDGITEVRLAVAASTLMLVLALTPLLFCGGITQLMFVGLAYPIIFGLLASFLVSLTLTGLMAARMLKSPSNPLSHERAGALNRLDDAYERLVRTLLRHRFTVIAAALCVIIVGAGFYQTIGSEMMPLADVGQAYGVLELTPGASYAQTEAATTAFEKILLRQPEIERVATEIGTEPGGTYFTGYAMNQVNTATLMLTLSDKDKRTRDIWQVMDGARAEALRTIPNIRRLQIKEMGSDVMASSAAPVQILVTGPDDKTLSRLAEQVAAIARQTPGASQVATSWAAEKPSYRLDVNAPRAAELSLTPAEIAEQAYYAMGGGLTSEFYRLPNIRQDTINVRYKDDQRRSPADLLQMTVTGKDGVQVPLKAVAVLTPERVPTLIEHDGLKRTISVLAYYRKGGPPSMDLAMQVITRASAEINFPPGYSLEMRGDMTQMMDSFARLLRGLELAVLFIFLVLVAQFRSLLAPLQMVLSIPLELAGVFGGLWLAHQAFSSVSIMAVIVLTGMDITTAILLLDQIQRRRAEGVLSRDAAIALACRDRLRPILMTALITIITMLPVALAPRTGMDAYQPLGTVIVAGLFVGTLLSLLVIPVMHSVVDDASRWLTRRRRPHPALLLLVGLLLLAPSAARAQMPQSLTRDEAVALALARNPDAQAVRADADILAAQARSVESSRRPRAAAHTFVTTGDSANIFGSAMPVAPGYNILVPRGGFADQNVSLEAPLFTGGRLDSLTRAARASASAAQSGAAGAGLTVARDTALAYHRALGTAAQVDAAKSRADTQDEQVRVTTERVKTGRLALIDLRREQAEQADARQALLAARNEAALALVDLQTILDLPPGGPLTLRDTLDSLLARAPTLPATLEDALAQADKQRPEIAAARQRIESARADIGTARSAYAPQIYGEVMADAAQMTRGSGSRGYSVGVTASLPLLDGGQRRADTDAARARLARAEADARNARRMAAQETASAWLALHTATAGREAAVLGVTAADEGYKLTVQRYEAGKSLAVERLAALAALTRARESLARASVAVLDARVRLARALGN